MPDHVYTNWLPCPTTGPRCRKSAESRPPFGGVRPSTRGRGMVPLLKSFPAGKRSGILFMILFALLAPSLAWVVGAPSSTPRSTAFVQHGADQGTHQLEREGSRRMLASTKPIFIK